MEKKNIAVFLEKLRGGLIVEFMQVLPEYAWVLLVLIVLEGLLAADNAIVLAIMVKHLPEEKRKKALFYGLLGAFVFRFGTLFIISYLVDIWQVQAIGALYLLYMGLNHVIRKLFGKESDETEEKERKKSGFWMTVLKVEIADIAFAIDSILAAVALGVTLPKIKGIGEIGGMHAGHFVVIFVGGLIGVIIMRFAANAFVSLLHKRPNLEVAAFFIVAWVGVKLAVLTLAHPNLGVIDEHFAHSTGWKLTFYIVLILIALIGWVTSKPSTSDEEKNT